MVTAIELHGRWVTVVQAVSTRRGVLISLLRTEELPEGGNAAVVIGRVLRAARVAGSRVVTCIGRDRVTLRDVILPSMDPGELTSMVEFQAAKLTPYPKAEILTGFRVVETTPEGSAKVALVIAQRSVVLGHLDLFRQIRTLPAWVGISSEALVAWFRSTPMGRETAAGAVALVDLDMGGLHMEILQDGCSAFSRAVRFDPGGGVEPAMPWRQRVVTELSRSLTTYQREQGGAAVARVVFSGPPSLLQDVRPVAEQELGRSVDVLNPLDGLPLKPGVRLPDLGGWQHPSVAVALGLALSPEPGPGLDLLPVDVAREAVQRVVRKELVVCGGLVGGVLLLGAAVFSMHLQAQGRVLRALDVQLASTSPVAAEIEAQQREIDVLKRQVAMEGSVLVAVDELYRLVPPEVSVNLLTWDGTAVSLRGSSYALSDAVRLVTILENSPQFKNVKLRSSSVRRVKDQELIDFQIHGLVEGETGGGS